MTARPPVPASFTTAATAAGDAGRHVETVQSRPAESTRVPRANAAWIADLLMLAGISLLVFVMLNMARRRHRARRLAASATPRERIDDMNSRAARADPAIAFSVEAEQLARRFASMLDNKAQRLELLLEDADARIARLERVLDMAIARSTSQATEAACGDAGGAQSSVTRSGERPDVAADAMRARLQPDEPHVKDGRSEAARAEAGAGPRDVPDPLARDVYALADQGLPAPEIARRLDQHTGKIELILALRTA